MKTLKGLSVILSWIWVSRVFRLASSRAWGIRHWPSSGSRGHN